MTMASPALAISSRVRMLAALSVAAGVGAVLAGVALLVAAGYLVARAAGRPPILDLALVFVAVRFFGWLVSIGEGAEIVSSETSASRFIFELELRVNYAKPGTNP